MANSKFERANIINNYYAIQSSYIKIYPSAYRSNDYDAGARLNLEENFVAQSRQGNKNYIQSWEDGLLICFIGGYLFKISVTTGEIDSDTRWLNIRTKNFQLVGSGSVSGQVNTTVLRNWYNNPGTLTDYYLDAKLGDGETAPYYFVGACFSSAPAVVENDNTIISLDLKAPSSRMPYDAEEVASILRKDADTRSIATNLVNGIAASNNSDKNYFNDTSITNIYYNNNDNKNAAAANTLNKTRYSFLFGKTVSIEGINSSTADYDFVLGRENHITNAGKYDTLLGQYLNSQYNNQFIIGKYNNNTSGNVFEIGWGSGTSGAADERKNIFEVNNSGNVSAKGTLAIGADVNESTLLTNVVLTVNKGSIDVFGGGAFGGAGTFGGTLGVTGATTLGSTLEVTSVTTLHNNLLITNGDLAVQDGNVGIMGTLAVSSTSNLQGEVSIDHTTLNLHKNTTTNNYDIIFNYNINDKCLEIKVI